MALVIASNLPAGHELESADVVLVPVSTAARPISAPTDVEAVLGKRLATPMDAGEVIVDRRLMGDGLLADAPQGSVAMTIKVEDLAEVAFLQPGDRVDVLAAPRAAEVSGPPQPAEVIARGVSVLVVPTAEAASDSGFLQAPDVLSTTADTPSILVAVPDETAEAIAGAAVNSRLSVVLRDAADQSP